MLLLGERIKEVRKTNGITQEKLAELIGVSRTAITRWESGETNPTVDHLIAVCRVLQINEGALLGHDIDNQLIMSLREMRVSLDQIVSIVEDKIMQKTD